jgi:hypothetical protein
MAEILRAVICRLNFAAFFGVEVANRCNELNAKRRLFVQNNFRFPDPWGKEVVFSVKWDCLK